MNNEVLVKVEGVSKKFCRCQSRCNGNLIAPSGAVLRAWFLQVSMVWMPGTGG